MVYPTRSSHLDTKNRNSSNLTEPKDEVPATTPQSGPFDKGPKKTRSAAKLSKIMDEIFGPYEPVNQTKTAREPKIVSKVTKEPSAVPKETTSVHSQDPLCIDAAPNFINLPQVPLIDLFGIFYINSKNEKVECFCCLTLMKQVHHAKSKLEILKEDLKMEEAMYQELSVALDRNPDDQLGQKLVMEAKKKIGEKNSLVDSITKAIFPTDAAPLPREVYDHLHY